MWTLYFIIFLLKFWMTVAFSKNKISKVLVLGGTGFVGRRFVDELSKFDPTIEITSISRRGSLPEEKNKNVNWLAGDVNEIVGDVISKYGPFDACIHAIGLLLDNESGLSTLNKFASGSGSSPDSKSSYDYVTRQTAFNSINSMKNQPNANKMTYIFISAAEAGWTIRPPVNWLARYLDAKRAVESELLNSSTQPILRPIIFRPSLIWTTERLQAIPSVLPFYIGSALGIPFIDRPVFVESLVKAMITGLIDENVSGIQRYKEIDQLSEYCKTS